MWGNVYGLDIETDTSPLTEAEKAAGFECRGLDPRISPVLNVAVTHNDGVEVFRNAEVGDPAAGRDLLIELDQFLRRMPSGIIATWNGSVFDMPFLDSVARTAARDIGLRLEHDPSIKPKYAPLHGYLGGYTATWSRGADRPAHAHVDVAYLYREAAARAGVAWKAKPVAKAVGLDAIEVDYDTLYALDAEAQDAYVASDANIARQLLLRALQLGAQIPAAA